jgi:hypothetical protein
VNGSTMRSKLRRPSRGNGAQVDGDPIARVLTRPERPSSGSTRTLWPFLIVPRGHNTVMPNRRHRLHLRRLSLTAFPHLLAQVRASGRTLAIGVVISCEKVWREPVLVRKSVLQAVLDSLDDDVFFKFSASPTCFTSVFWLSSLSYYLFVMTSFTIFL